MAHSVDLSQLATPRASAERPLSHQNRLTWLTRILLPLILIAGFAGALGYSFREAFLPATPVTVVPVLALQSEMEHAAGTLFRSAGWVEPRPTPVIVSALEEGVVARLLVIEGQELKEGDEVARLIEADAKLRLQGAEAEVDSRQAELASSQAALAAAEIRLREPIELQTKLAEAETLQARAENELSRLPNQVKAAKSRAALAASEKQSRMQSSDVVGRLALERAANELEGASAALGELESQRIALEKELAAHDRRVAGLRRQLELKTEEQQKRDEALAAVDLAKSRLAQANISLETSKLALSRMTIQAPCDGKVLALVARPGSKVMGLAPAAMPDASTVITMYDPARLQIRADVRLEEVPRVFPGQAVRIETPAVKGTMIGEVIAMTSLTDIQKNTLQVKIAVKTPPAVLKPDMLVEVSFLSPPTTREKSSSSDGPLALVIPPDLVERHGEQSHVWIADRRDGTAQMRDITTGGTTPEGLLEVKSGLAAGDRLIVSGREGLQPGDRIRIVGEDSSPPRASTAAQPPKKLKRLNDKG
jgi:HlyD family secretion protein